MTKVFAVLKPLYFIAAVGAAAFFVTLPAAPSALAQGDSWCEENYPGDTHCHDDMKRGDGPTSCALWGCHTGEAICCIDDT
jgi:hypothetical protein